MIQETSAQMEAYWNKSSGSKV